MCAHVLYGPHMWVYTSRPTWEADVRCSGHGQSGFGVGRGVCQQWVVVCAGRYRPVLAWAGSYCLVLADGSPHPTPPGLFIPRSTLLQLPVVTLDSIFSLLQTTMAPLGPQGSAWPHLLSFHLPVYHCLPASSPLASLLSLEAPK